ncbi:MAG TPA: FkbM family methyltransferase [Xanthobacteraceae bacterium]|nr:FkbM family methyltransferase [Xanthobacteraceae bacterium]
MAEQIFRHPIGAVEQRLRRLYCETLPKLGIPHFIVGAQGARFYIGNEDMIDRHIGWDSIWDPVQLNRLGALCRANRFDRFLDIGANTGFYSILLTDRGLVPEALAFEPDPGTRELLNTNIALNGLGGKIRVLPYALGEATGTAMLTQSSEINRGESWIEHVEMPAGADTVTVDVRRLDDEFAFKGETLLAKIDVEGYEFHTLRGMERTLRENSCYLQVELYSPRIEELKAAFARLGYRYLDTWDIDHYFTNIDGLT